jgi:iron complex outermembrane recepter protein
VRRFYAAIVACFAFPLAVTTAARADTSVASSDQTPLQTIVVTATAIPGASIGIDKVPGNVQILNSADISREGSASLTTALNSNLSSVNINDDINDPFQPDILYRGFEASPVLGTPQGLAIYENGVRINEAFGDTVNWDLIPDIAINQVELISSSPVYGLNALGGAIAVGMKNGFNYQGGEVDVTGGMFGLHALTAQYGVKSGDFGFYIAGRALDSDNWRPYSQDNMRDYFTALSYHTDTATLDLSYTRSDNRMNGQGPTPVQELALNPSLVFTGPQTNINVLNFLVLNGTLKLTDTWSLQSVLYYRNYAQTVSNGNTTDYEACTNTPGILCQPDGVTPLTNAAGQHLPDISDGGTKIIGENDFELIHAWGRGATLQATDSQSIFGFENQFTIGAAVNYASASFYTGAQIGLINSQLIVLPSNLIVYTPENSNAAIANGDPVPVSVDSVNKNFAGYLTDTLNVTPDLAVTASGRYNVANVNLADQLGSNLSGYSRFVHFNPALGATYKVLPTMTVYGGFSQNTRTPTASEIACSNPLQPCLLPTNLAGDPPNLHQVVSHTGELGLRGTIPHVSGPASEMSWNLSVFRTLLKDDIYGIATSVSQGFYQNIGDTRRQGVEAGLSYKTNSWSTYANYSFVQATFRSPFTESSPSNPFQNALGDVEVLPGDHLPGIPEHRVKLGADYKILPQWTLGTTVNFVSDFYYVGDESNQLQPIGGYTVVNLHTSYKPLPHFEMFASINNLLNRRYGTWGILSDPTGIDAPGIPPNGTTNGPGINNRFLSPAAPLEAFGGIRIEF